MSSDNMVQQSIENLILSNEESTQKMKILTEQYNSDQFSTVKYLEDGLLNNLTSNNVNHIKQYSSLLFSLLMNECKDDKFRIQQTYDRIYNYYINNDNTKYLIDILSALLLSFTSYLQIQSDNIFALIVKKDNSKLERILQYLSIVLNPKINQIISNEMSIMELNLQQKCLVNIQEDEILVDELLSIAQYNQNKSSNQSQIKKKQKSNIKPKNESSDVEENEDLINLSINCLIQLRNNANKSQKSSITNLLIKKIKQIIMICNKDEDLIHDSIFFLQKQKETFYKGNEEAIIHILNQMLYLYYPQITISDNNYVYVDYKISELNEKAFVHYINNENNVEIYTQGIIYKSNPNKINIAKQTAFWIMKNILYINPINNKSHILKSKSSTEKIFNLILHISALTHSVYLKEFNTFDSQLNQNLENIYTFICEENCKAKFLQFLLLKLNSSHQIYLEDYNSKSNEFEILLNENQNNNEIQNNLNENEQKKQLQCEQNQIYNRIKNIGQNTIIEDGRVALIGCYIVLEYLTGKITEDIKGMAVQFMKNMKYHLEDSFLFNYAIAFLAELMNCFNINMAAYHQTYMPQLIRLIKINRDFMRIKLFDTFIKLYDQLPLSKSNELYPYLKQILQICIQEYTKKDFFQKDRQLLNDNVLKLIKLIIELPDIEFYLKNEIYEMKEVALKMIKDEDQRENLIQNNHQVLLVGLVQLEKKMKNNVVDLQEEIQNISLNLAQRIFDKGNEMEKFDKIKIYDFFKNLTTEVVGCQKIIEKVFLLTLPHAIKDTQQNVSFTLHNMDQLQQMYLNRDQVQGPVDDDGEEEVLSDMDIEDFQQLVNQNQQMGANGGQGQVGGQQQHGNEDEEEFEDINSENENGDEEEEDEFDQQIDLQFKQPQEILVETAIAALSVMAAFAEQCPDLFFNYKKFEIFQILGNYQINKFLGDRLAMKAQSVVGRILISAQKYFIDNPTMQKCDIIDIKPEVLLSEDIQVEITPILDLFLIRFLDDNQSIIIKNGMDNLLVQVVITTQKLCKEIFVTYFDRFYSTYHQLFFESMKELNSNQMEQSGTNLVILLRNMSTKILEKLPFVQKMIEEFLSNNSVFVNESYQSFKQRYEQQQLIKQQKLKMNSNKKFKTKSQDDNQIHKNSDPFLTIQCICKIQELLQIEPNCYEIISPLYNYIIFHEDFSEYEQYIQYICEYVKKIIRFCPKNIDLNLIKRIDKVFQPLVLKIDEEFYQELSPVENLRLAFAMIGMYIDQNNNNNNDDESETKKTIQNKQEQEKSIPLHFKLFIEYLPFRDEPSEYSYILLIISHLINHSYELDAIQQDYIILSLLKGIDDPMLHETTSADITLTFEVFNLFKTKYPNVITRTRYFIEKENWRNKIDELKNKFNL